MDDGARDGEFIGGGAVGGGGLGDEGLQDGVLGDWSGLTGMEKRVGEDWRLLRETGMLELGLR